MPNPSPSSNDEALFTDSAVKPTRSSTKSDVAWSENLASDRLVGAVLCTISAAGFASLSILGKLAVQLGLSLVTILSLRFGVAALLLAFFLKAIKRRRLFFGWRETIPLILLGSVGYTGQSTLYFASLERNPASISSLLLYVYPVFVALLSWVLNRKGPSRREIGATIIVSTGVVLTVSNDTLILSLSTSVDPLGVVLVLASAAWYAGYIVTSDRYVHTAGPWVSTAWIALGAGLSFLLMGAFTQTLNFRLSGDAAMILLAMVLLCTIMALGTFLAGMGRVGPTAASLLSTLEPIFTVILALFFLEEYLSPPPQMAGGALVLTAVIILTIPQDSKKAAFIS
jgi:drug/metabolite transporter (DMT)-like permease